MNNITINSELDLFDKTGNSAHARWVAERLLSARKNGAISEVELAVFDASLASDFSAYSAYQAGLGCSHVKDTASSGAAVDMNDLIKATFSKFSFVSTSSPGKSVSISDSPKLVAFDELHTPEPALSKVSKAVAQAREYLSMTRLHFDETAVGASHLMHYIRMAEVQMDRALLHGFVQ